MKKAPSFTVEKAVLENVTVDGETMEILYRLDGVPLGPRLHYEGLDLRRGLPGGGPALERFAAALAAFAVARFGAVLPKRVDFGPAGSLIPRELVDFLRYVLPGVWSEHRYQLGRLGFHYPEFVAHGSPPAASMPWPIWTLPDSGNRVLLATGSGKDGTLCGLMLGKAGIPFDAIGYLHDQYGDVERQRDLFAPAEGRLRSERHFRMTVRDEYYPWLEERIQRFGIEKHSEKPFRREAGEVFLLSLAMIPFQIAYDIPLQVFGDEKSADRPNLIDPETGEPVAHQWEKSIHGERALHGLYARMFSNLNRASLLKPLHDARIFHTLFALDPDIAYLTNSCNIRKPWCGRCEKCAYVFAGFSAYGDPARTIAAFGADLLDDPALLAHLGRVVGPEETYRLGVRRPSRRGATLFLQDASQGETGTGDDALPGTGPGGPQRR
uniref:MurL C-terminal domain-containing protein n=1 Tax=Candidatus Kentrum eta TaxID=2126337 RepID=A0A450UZU8_9GAMM|nr:MAG: hypothetical protein BECKH772A_GA0070896_1013111 [Candidatus Kentron sp. H]VFK00165.1 MAG: hypothetical protein BECKH772B_GA0070898_101819 [Candidatus Kentron sp. H]VFK03375.1 MAG: hypothetical protein BECKH772C_GA0070978_1012611 [Candidatus Kentron sp. H]